MSTEHDTYRQLNMIYGKKFVQPLKLLMDDLWFLITNFLQLNSKQLEHHRNALGLTGTGMFLDSVK